MQGARETEREDESDRPRDEPSYARHPAERRGEDRDLDLPGVSREGVVARELARRRRPALAVASVPPNPG